MFYRVDLKGASLDDRKGILNEVRILASIEHPNIIAYKEAFVDSASSSLCIVMEYASKGDLRHLIDSTKEEDSSIDEEIIWKYAVQILQGVSFLHEMKIAHRDLKVRFQNYIYFAFHQFIYTFRKESGDVYILMLF